MRKNISLCFGITVYLPFPDVRQGQLGFVIDRVTGGVCIRGKCGSTYFMAVNGCFLGGWGGTMCAES